MLFFSKNTFVGLDQVNFWTLYWMLTWYFTWNVFHRRILLPALDRRKRNMLTHCVMISEAFISNSFLLCCCCCFTVIKSKLMFEIGFWDLFSIIIWFYKKNICVCSRTIFSLIYLWNYFVNEPNVRAKKYI